MVHTQLKSLENPGKFLTQNTLENLWNFIIIPGKHKCATASLSSHSASPWKKTTSCLWKTLEKYCSSPV
jgi:hypothetical protein